MMYPFMTLDNLTEITHSDVMPDGRVKVYIETPDETDGFHCATCWLPEYKWEEVTGYGQAELEKYKKLIISNAHLIMDFAKSGGFLNASNL